MASESDFEFRDGDLVANKNGLFQYDPPVITKGRWRKNDDGTISYVGEFEMRSRFIAREENTDGHELEQMDAVRD